MTEYSRSFAPFVQEGSLFALETVEAQGRTHTVFRNGPRTLSDIFHRAARAGTAPLLLGDDGVLSRETLLARAGGQAAFLAGRGIGKGSRVALALAKDADWIVALIALTALGATAVLPSEHSAAAMRHAMTAARCQWAITDLSGQQDVSDLAALCTAPLAPLPATAIEPAVEAIVAFTSGSSGTPKGVILTHRAITTGLLNMMLAGTVAARGGPSARPSRPALPTVLLRTSLAHVSGYMQILAMLWIGGRVLRTTDTDITGLIAKHTVTSVTGISDAEIVQLLEAGDAGSLRSVSVVGRALPAATRTNLRRGLPDLGVGSGYGLTETSGLVAAIGNNMLDARPRAVGPVVPTMECRVIADGQDAPSGAVGQIWLRGSALMSDYCNIPGSISDDGWFATGDTGFLAPDGCLHLLDKGDRIVRAGEETIACRDIEDMVRQISGLVEVAAMPLPHGRGLLVAGTGLADTAALQMALAARLPGELAQGLRVQAVAALPRTPSGKIAYAQLLESDAAQP